MEPIVEVEYDENLLNVFNEHEFASVELGEWDYVWCGGEERPELAEALAGGSKSLDDVMKELEHEFEFEPKLWVKMYEKEGDATIYVLMPKFVGVFAHHLQLYMGAICKCRCPVSVGVICNAPEPWDCMHSTAFMCAKCGEEIAKLSAIHGGGRGGVIRLREFEVLREMAVKEEKEEASEE